ncbi:uncharacterized protein BCR38DRAFT_89613 [Pseudomassariella vexata]|uniref:Uncharacterized protein n=1 Tax=Pseudomassariella vexata TaxID=1141098 RepID=A0A1Y2EDK2_9PEZI|nr:uncharacterized protein BCR38DRAFT_89613 [Pseudomassariella vexata]ORY69651.1 hypothetical protein BCR38DRAFT_89613 [Pseudomassariella vexata]
MGLVRTGHRPNSSGRLPACRRMIEPNDHLPLSGESENHHQREHRQPADANAFQDNQQYQYQGKTLDDVQRPSAKADTTPPGDMGQLLAKQNVNVWNPSQTTNITVHLDMDVEHDLDGSLEEFARLIRLGNFAAAKEFFADNLEEHMDKPYVLVQYAEMLLEQGDYKAIAELEDDPIWNAEGNILDNEEGRLIQMYWGLMLLYADCHKPGTDPRRFSIISDTLDTLHSTVNPEGRDIASTEIKILALIIRFCSFPHVHVNRIELHQHLEEMFPETFYKSLYTNLLRQGRIWDFHDIMLARITVENIQDMTGFWTDCSGIRLRLRALKTDWTSPDGDIDISTSLALLSIFTSIVIDYCFYFNGKEDMVEGILDQSRPLAQSVSQNDPQTMKSRPYIKWIIAKAQFSNEKGPNETDAFVQYLQSTRGVVYHYTRRGLPRYVPVNDENPGWKLSDAEDKYKNPIKLALKTAQELGDYNTQEIALQQLIRLTSNPLKEFDML